MSREFNLKRLRNDLGVKQSEIASILDIPQSSVSAMENGKTVVSPTYIDKLQSKYQINNIEDYYDDVEVVRIQNNRGTNNGYKNTLTSALDAKTISSIVEIHKDVSLILSSYEERLRNIEKKRDELENENRQLHRQLTAFQVLCAKNGIDFEHLIAE